MSAVPITLVGSSTTSPDGQTTFVGVAVLTGLGLGGGPMPGGQPPRPWGPINSPDQGLPGNQPYPGQGLPGSQPLPGQGLPGNQPYPGQGLPGGRPPGTWGGGGVGNYPDAGFPVPQPPQPFPEPPPEGNKPPPPNGGWGYSSQYGWGYFPNPSGGGKPQPGDGEGGEEQPEHLPA